MRLANQMLCHDIQNNLGTRSPDVNNYLDNSNKRIINVERITKPKRTAIPKLSICEAFFSICNSKKIKLAKSFENIIKMKLRQDYILKSLGEISNLKNVLFNDKQRKLFNSIRLNTYAEEMSEITKENSLPKDVIEDLVKEMRTEENDSELNRRLIAKIL